ncbi:MAG TPA: hypothetical protein GX528_00215 [Firmicutes bacterium]|nr:hypothetical protein [Bacillota bacterium]
MPNPTQKIMAWLRSKENSTLNITKEEDGDQDKIELLFERVDFVEHHDPGDYLAKQALLLHGRGETMTDFGQKPLPGGIFEIALNGKWSAEVKDSSLHLSTDRGAYKIVATAKNN